jgi:hypothetical protein
MTSLANNNHPFEKLTLACKISIIAECLAVWVVCNQLINHKLAQQTKIKSMKQHSCLNKNGISEMVCE